MCLYLKKILVYIGLLMIELILFLLLVVGLLASFVLVFGFNGYKEFRNDILHVVRLLDRQDYSADQIVNILSVYGVIERKTWVKT